MGVNALSKKVSVVGGTSGLGLAIAISLLEDGWQVTVYGRHEPAAPGLRFIRHNLLSDDLSLIDTDVDAFIYAAGAGRVARFGDLTGDEISRGFRVNSEAPARLLSRILPNLRSRGDFRAAFIGSVAGEIPSPMFAAYGAQKAALKSLIQSVNAEIAYDGCANRVLLVEPGYIPGTGFYGGGTDIDMLMPLAARIIEKMNKGDMLFLPDEKTYLPIIEKAAQFPEKFAASSMAHKIESGRASDTPKCVRGFLSGTFDLFHVGHLNLLERAKRYCDFLTVGVHPEGSKHKSKPVFVPLEERMRIVGAVKYVDRVVVTLDEDDDMYFKEPFDMLFVGSDYKGTPRFERYERVLSPLGVKIIYFPYTDGTSSTQLRNAISGKETK